MTNNKKNKSKEINPVREITLDEAVRLMSEEQGQEVRYNSTTKSFEAREKKRVLN
tara:strand:- start:307 stop:471 length:165 start_codon:yes stop_codon:yes gene_type:complete